MSKKKKYRHYDPQSTTKKSKFDIFNGNVNNPGDMEYIYSEIEKFKSNTAVLCLEIEHLTGKLVNEA